VALYKAELPVKKIVTQVIIFSLAGPIGIIIGWILSQSSLLISSIFKAVPAGIKALENNLINFKQELFFILRQQKLL